MSSQIITPPDFVDTDDGVLIINAFDFEIEFLILWLQNTNISYNIHLYHLDMNDNKWLYERVLKSKLILNNSKFIRNLPKEIIDKLKNSDNCINFGDGQFRTVLDYFFLKHVEV